MGQKASKQAASHTSGASARLTPKQLTISPDAIRKSHPVYGKNSIMSDKAHGTSDTPVQDNLRWGCDFSTADRICNFNRHFAEHSGYFQGKRKFLKAIEDAKAQGDQRIRFYDSNTGDLLFEAPQGRSWDAWLIESKKHGWPSFRDAEVNWQHVRCLKGGEAVSLAGTHLGHNIPDGKGNRYCINLVCVAGNPTNKQQEEEPLLSWPQYDVERKESAPETKTETTTQT